MELSLRSYAKHRGVSEAAVRKAIKQGRITKSSNGKVDPKIADQDWQNNTDPAQIKITDKTESVRKAQKSIRSELIEIPSYQESRAIKEDYNARLTKLQFERESKKLIPVSEVRRSAFNTARTVRDRILNIPDRVIPQLVGKTNIFEMKEILHTELTKALEELSKLNDKKTRSSFKELL